MRGVTTAVFRIPADGFQLSVANDFTISGGGGRIAVWYGMDDYLWPRILENPDNLNIIGAVVVSNALETFTGTAHLSLPAPLQNRV